MKRSAADPGWLRERHRMRCRCRAWPAGRKVAAGTLAAAGLVVLAGTAVYLSAVLFLVLNQADPHQAGIHEHRALLGPVCRRCAAAQEAGCLDRRVGDRAAGGTAGLPCSLRLDLVGRCMAMHGSRIRARWRVPGCCLYRRSAVDRPGPASSWAATGASFLALPGQLSVMLSAPTRSGKGVGVVIPNLLNWPDSVVVLDIKGENYEITAGYRAERGQAVYAFSPFDEAGRSHRWNPLSAVRTSPLHRVGDLLTIGQVFFPNDGSGTSSEAFFNDQARNLFLGLGLVLLETPELPRTIGELLRQSSGRGPIVEGAFVGV
ncbi:MAG: type IV secretory system conjugative DNA transfer family protein [Burkholderiaceae bacterium]